MLKLIARSEKEDSYRLKVGWLPRRSDMASLFLPCRRPCGPWTLASFDHRTCKCMQCGLEGACVRHSVTLCACVRRRALQSPCMRDSPCISTRLGSGVCTAGST